MSIAGIATTLTLSAVSTAWGQSTLQALPAGFVPRGIAFINAPGMPPVVGSFHGLPAKWTEAGGPIALDPAGPQGEAVALVTGGEGDTVVGTASVAGFNRAFRWTSASGFTLIEPPAGYQHSEAVGVSVPPDGVVGSLYTNEVYLPFYWRSGQGLMLAPMAPGSSMRAVGGSLAYLVCGNFIDTSSGRPTGAWSWSPSASTIESYATPPGWHGVWIEAAYSGVACGAAFRADAGGVPVEWQARTLCPPSVPGPNIDHGPSPGAHGTLAVAGPFGRGFVVGSATGPGETERAWVRRGGSALRDLRQVLLDGGATNAAAWELHRPIDLLTVAVGTFDGYLCIVGRGMNPSGQPAFWLARTDYPCYVDCNWDQQHTVADFGCFQSRLILKDVYADCNGEGFFTVADFGCFQTQFSISNCQP